MKIIILNNKEIKLTIIELEFCLPGLLIFLPHLFVQPQTRLQNIHAQVFIITKLSHFLLPFIRKIHTKKSKRRQKKKFINFTRVLRSYATQNKNESFPSNVELRNNNKAKAVNVQCVSQKSQQVVKNFTFFCTDFYQSQSFSLHSINFAVRRLEVPEKCMDFSAGLCGCC